MKKIFLSALSLSLFLLAGCSGGKTDDNANAGVPQGMVAADLSNCGMSVLVNIPDSTVAPPEIIANAQGGADVKVGKNFQITITEGAGDIALKKNDITHDDIRKFIKYIVEEPNYLVWEWQIEGMEPEFHFYAIVKDGEKIFEVRDVEGEVFSEKAATQMLDAAKSIRVKAAVKAES
ncbi:MAG: hypothetical protein EPN85_15060 [Bacteroidetes bacterium]|nr:MAG: hypothetical protein EPN85_15060 [Bacteroidota bacterium]